MDSSGRGWHKGISSPVRLAAMMPAIRAAARASPLAKVPERRAARASADIATSPRAVAARAVAALADTSTMRASPSAERWLLFTGVLLRVLVLRVRRRRAVVLEALLEARFEGIDG